MNPARIAAIAVSSLLFSLVGCAVPAASDLDDEASATGEEALTLQVVVPISTYPLPVVDRLGLNLFTSNAHFRSVFGRDATGVDFSREWVVFYAPGSAYSTSTSRVSMTRSGDGRSLSLLGQIKSPGRGCFTALPAHPPYFLGKISRTGISANATVNLRYDRIVTPCTGGFTLNHCAYTGCPAGQICRIVDGVDGCMANPSSCDFVACPVGSVCAMVAGRTTCGRPPATIPLDDGVNVTFPPGDLMVSFPLNGIPSVCRTVKCGAGKACAVGFDGRAKCVAIGGGTLN